MRQTFEQGKSRTVPASQTTPNRKGRTKSEKQLPPNVAPTAEQIGNHYTHIAEQLKRRRATSAGTLLWLCGCTRINDILVGKFATTYLLRNLTVDGELRTTKRLSCRYGVLRQVDSVR